MSTGRFSAIQRKSHQPTIQDAIDAALPGDTVFISSGVYEEAVEVIGKSDRLVRGHGAVTIDAGAAPIGLRVAGSSGIKIERLRVQASKETSGFEVETSDDVVLRRCRVSGAGEHGIYVHPTATAVQAMRCRVLDGGKYSTGIHLESAGALVRKCRVRGGQNGLVIQGSTNVVADNELEKQYHGIRVYAFSGVATGNLIVGNRVKKVKAHGISFASGASNNHLVGNRIVRCGTGIVGDLGADDLVMVDNRIIRSTGTALQLAGSAAYVAGNKMRRPELSGRGLFGTGLFESNIVRHAGTGMLIFSSGSVFIEDSVLGSDMFDLNDKTGGVGNTYVENEFGSSNL